MYTKFAMEENDVGIMFALSSKHIYIYIYISTLKVDSCNMEIVGMVAFRTRLRRGFKVEVRGGRYK